MYTGIAVISNRITPSHRDSKGRPQWFDTLISYSDPTDQPQLLLEDLGLELDYHSGMVVALCGTVLKHGVGSWGDGDRACYAHFMREAVRKKLDAPVAGWVNRSVYLSDSDKEMMDNRDIDMDLDLIEIDDSDDDIELIIQKMDNINREMGKGYTNDDFELDFEDIGDSDDDFELDFEDIADDDDDFEMD